MVVLLLTANKKQNFSFLSIFGEQKVGKTPTCHFLLPVICSLCSGCLLPLFLLSLPCCVLKSGLVYQDQRRRARFGVASGFTRGYFVSAYWSEHYRQYRSHTVSSPTAGKQNRNYWEQERNSSMTTSWIKHHRQSYSHLGNGHKMSIHWLKSNMNGWKM